MKRMLLKILLVLIIGFMYSPSFSQMIKAPTTKPGAGKKKPVTKPVVKFKDDDDEKTDSATSRPGDARFAYLVIKANRGSVISVNINNNESGKIRAGMSKRITLENADEMRISLNDTEGNQYDTTFVVVDKDAGNTIVVAFPEVDYAAIRNERLRLKKEQEEKDRLVKEEVLRIKREAEEVLRNQRTGLLAETEIRVKELIKQTLTDKADLQQLINRVKKGEILLDENVAKTHDIFLANKAYVMQNIKAYADSGMAYNMRERKDHFLREIKADQDNIVKDEFHTFVTAVIAGKKPMSESVEVAFKASRSFDIPFFIPKDSLEEAVVAGKYPLIYALEVKSNATVFKYLFDNGVSANNFGSRFSENKDIYATPLAYACINGDLEVLRLLIAKQAQFFPPAMSKQDKKKQVKFLLSKFGDRTEVLSLLKENNYDMDDGTAAALAALNHIDSSMVLVEGGSFTMGCTNELTADCAGDEKPTIKVTVDHYYIGRFEITQREWAAFMDDESPSFFKDCPNCPVEMVNWNLVNEFIQKLNKVSGRKFRLPTEAEWEYAARGGKSADAEFNFAGGKDLNEVGWHKDNANKTSPIGLKKPNALGLYDMSGNVAEWCSDYYASDYFSRSSLVNPKGPDMSTQRVTRGGSVMQSSWSARLSNREGHEEEFNNNSVGFRLAMDK